MFDAQKEKDKIVKFIRDYYKDNNLGGVVIGISGGKDSGVVAGLFSEAIGPENIIGITMPCHSKDTDKKDALRVSDYYGFEMIDIDLTDTLLRMTSLYYVAALYSAIKKKTYIVAGTGNKCEEFVGYFTKGGDSVSDIKVLADLTVEEVIKVGEVLNVPKEVLYKTPNDGLSNTSDEDKLGVKYADIAKYMNKEELDEDIKKKIEKLHKKSLHKFNIPTYRKN